MRLCFDGAGGLGRKVSDAFSPLPLFRMELEKMFLSFPAPSVWLQEVVSTLSLFSSLLTE